MGLERQQFLIMSEKKHELLLFTAAVLISALTFLFGIFDSPKNNPLEAAAISMTVTEASSVSHGKVNINTADMDELMQLEEIGEKKASAIIEYREENGRFRKPEEITNVSGIGEAILRKNIDRITV